MRLAAAGGKAFPVLLLAFGGFFFLGRLGWWSDDYWHNQRHPVTGEITHLVIHRGFFLRPLFYRIVPPLTTLAWDHDWIAHGLQILSHGGVVWLLWRLMLTLGLSRRASSIAALLFMVYPPQFEALFWVASLPTSVAAGVMLVVFHLAVRWARGGRLWMLVAMPVLTFALCCLNEQPAAGVLALPLVGLAAGGEGGFKSRLRRSLIPGALCTAAAALYTAAVILDAPPGSRGSGQNFVTITDLPHRVDYFATVLWRRLYMRNFARGALGLGWEQVHAAGALAWVALGAVTATGLCWAFAKRSNADADSAMPNPQSTIRNPQSLFPVLALGPAVFLGGCIPILILSNYDPDSRTRYWPCIGVAMLIATLGTLAARIRHPRPAAVASRAALSVATVATTLVFAIMLVGIQSAFRARYRLDQEQAAQLRQLVPNPAPYTFFVPLDIQTLAVQTGSPVLDRHLRSVWEFAWTTPGYIQRVYGREDVRCGYWRHWTPGLPVKGADLEGIHFQDTLGPRFPALPDGSRLIPWDRAIPFTIDRGGTVHVPDTVILAAPGRPDVEIPIPQAPKDRGEPAIRLPSLIPAS